MKLSKHQLALLARLFVGVQPSTNTIQNTARSLIAAGLVHRYKSGGRVWLTALPPGLRAYSDHLNAKKAKQPTPLAPCNGDPVCRTHQGGKFGSDPSRECRR